MFYLRCSIGIKRNKKKMQVFFLSSNKKNEEKETQNEINVLRLYVYGARFSHSNYEAIPFSFISGRKQLNVQSVKIFRFVFIAKWMAKCIEAKCWIWSAPWQMLNVDCGFVVWQVANGHRFSKVESRPFGFGEMVTRVTIKSSLRASNNNNYSGFK